MTTMSTGPLGLSCSSTRRQGPPSVPAWSAALSGGTPDARLGPHALGGLVRGLLPSWYAMSGPLRRLSAVRRTPRSTPFLFSVGRRRLLRKATFPVGILKRSIAVLGAGALLLGAAACSGSSSTPKAAADGTASELRLGYFPNITHATAVYGVASGVFQKDLGSTKLTTKTFNAGPAAIEALRGGALDAAFLGPNPAINGFTQTNGSLLRIVAGATSGGAALVTQPDVTDVAQLAGKKVATPQVGNTQDVAAKYYFKDTGVKANVIAVPNADVEQAFSSKSISPAGVPEPYASRLVLKD